MRSPAVFVDRDGTLIEHYEYLTNPHDVQLMPTVAPALRLLRDRGFKLVMVTNQSAIARGLLTEKKLLEIHDRLKELLAGQGVYLDRIYYCPYHPEAVVEKYRQDSDLRKPKPGMLHLAARELDIEISQSWIVGDDDRDVQTGHAGNCRTILLESYGAVGVHRENSKPDFRAASLLEAANTIVRHANSQSPAQEKHPQETLPDEPIAQAASQPPPEPHRLSENEKLEEAPPEPPTKKIAPIPNHYAKAATKNDETLGKILREMKALNRQQSFTEFSIAKLFAGIMQMVVVFFLVVALRFGIAAEPKPESVQICLLSAGVFQLLTLTLLVMHKQ